jgi:anti-sigma B factor antagonist
MDIMIKEYAIRYIAICLHGRVDASTIGPLRTQVDHLLNEGVHFFVLDLSGVTFLDSTGLALLIYLLKRSQQVGGDVKMVFPTDEATRRLLQLTRFDRVFEVVESVDLALSSF